MNKKKKEHGVALLMSLGILSLLLVLAVSFVFNSKTNVLVSKVYDRNSQTMRVGNDSIYWFRRGILHWVSIQVFGLQNRSIPLRVNHNQSIWPGLLDVTEGYGTYMDFEDEDGASLTYSLGFLASPEADEVNTRNVKTSGNPLAWWGIVDMQDRLDHDGSEIDYGLSNINNAYHTRTVGRRVTLILNEDIKFDLNGMILGEELGTKGGGIFTFKNIFSSYGVRNGEELGIEIAAEGLKNFQDADGNALPWRSWEELWNYSIFCGDPDYPSSSEESNARDAYHAVSPYTALEGEWYQYHGEYLHRFYLGQIAIESSKYTSSYVESRSSEIYKNDNFLNNTRFFDSSRYKNTAAACGDNSFNLDSMRLNARIHGYTHDETRFIPWLSEITGHLTDDELGSDESAQNWAIRKQVLANLIDYSDNNGMATTDYKGSGSTEKVEFCGLEKSFYTAGVSVSLEVGQIPADTGGKLFIQVQPVVKLVFQNPYDEPFTKPVSVYLNIYDNGNRTSFIKGETISVNSGESSELTLRISNPYDLECDSEGKFSRKLHAEVVIAVGDAVNVSDVTVVKNMGLLNSGEGSTVSGESNTVYNCYAIFRDPRANNYVDMQSLTKRSSDKSSGSNAERKNLAHLYLDSYGCEWDDSGVLAEAEGNEKIASYNLKDIYENLYEVRKTTGYDDHPYAVDSDDDPVYRAITCTGTAAGYINPDPYYSCMLLDYEDDPEQPSTAVVRDEHITNLWELGAIHRGEPFRTLNTKVSFTPDGDRCYPRRSSGGWNTDRYTGRYEHGDGAIMAQTKITKEAFSYPQLTVFNPMPEYWDAVYECFTANPEIPQDAKSDLYGPGAPTYHFVKPSNMEKNTLNQIREIGGIYDVNYEGMPIGIEGLLAHLSWCGVYHRETYGASEANSQKNGEDYAGREQKNDFDAEEYAGKIATFYKDRYNFYRVINTTQTLERVTGPMSDRLDRIKLTDDSEHKLRHYRKIHEYYGGTDLGQRWYKVTGQTKQLAIIRRFSRRDFDFGVVEQQVIDSDTE